MTDPDRHLLTLFGEALELGSPGERAAYLDRACRGDAALCQRVEALVQAHGKAGRFLEGQPPGDPTASAVGRHGSEGPGTVIGPYKLLEQIGEGGFGVVFLAEQTQWTARRGRTRSTSGPAATRRASGGPCGSTTSSDSRRSTSTTVRMVSPVVGSDMRLLC